MSISVNYVGYLANFMQDIHDVVAPPNSQPMTIFNKVLVSVAGFHESEIHNEVEYGGVEVISNLTLYVRLAEFDVKSAPKLSEVEKCLALKKIARVKEFLLRATEGNQWSHLKGSYLKQDFIDELRMIAMAVGAAGTTKVFDASTAKDNSEKLREILDSLGAAEMPYKLKAALVDHVSSLIEIFDTFQIFGPRDAERRVKEIVIDLGLYNEDLTPDTKKTLTPLIAFCGEAMGKFKTGVDFIQAGQHVLKLFGIDTGASE